MGYENFNIQDSKHIIRDAGVTVEEIIAMLPITKQTYYNWLRGNTIRDQLRFGLVAVRFAILAKAVTAGFLPLPEHTPKGQRAGLIAQAMQQAKR